MERTCGMRQESGGEARRLGAWLILLAAILLAVPRVTSAQGGMQDGPVEGGGFAGGQFAGGQMVRGTVTAVAPDHLTVKTEEGDVYQVAVSANTRVMKDRQPVKVVDIKAGDGVGAMGVMDAPTKTVHAVFVAVVDAEQVKKAREDLGKTFITGRVTAIDMDEARVTVKRPDGVSQVIQADEGTSFKRGGRRVQTAANGTPAAGAGTRGESITLADVKVGDMVAGRGAMKSGMFVPAELRVMDASALGQGRRRGATNGSPDAPVSSPNANGSGSSR